MTDSPLVDALRLVVALLLLFGGPFLYELGRRLGRYVAERREVLDRVDALIESARKAPGKRKNRRASVPEVSLALLTLALLTLVSVSLSWGE